MIPHNSAPKSAPLPIASRINTCKLKESNKDGYKGQPDNNNYEAEGLINRLLWGEGLGFIKVVGCGVEFSLCGENVAVSEIIWQRGSQLLK